MGIILASESPRRSELLARMGLEFEVRIGDHDETMNLSADPSDEVARVSRLQVEAVYPFCQDDDVIIGADTIVARIHMDF